MLFYTFIFILIIININSGILNIYYVFFFLFGIIISYFIIKFIVRHSKCKL